MRDIAEPQLLGQEVRRTTGKVGGAVKPRLRGWLHAAMIPLTVVLGAVLLVATPGAAGRTAVAAYCLSALLLFTVSATYHTQTWSEPVRVLLRRLDHANIFVLIAGSYTPYAVLVLPPDSARALLAVVWTGAVAGVAFRVLWVTAPRWFYVPIYIGLGWAAVFWAGEFAAGASAAALTLMVLGGVLYTLGALVYGMKRPDPAPAWFGFHEIFHTFTIAAFLVHYAGIWLVL